MSSKLSSFGIKRHEVVGHFLYLRYLHSVEVCRRIDDECIMKIPFQLYQQFVLLWNVTNNMQFIVLRLQHLLFPCVEQVIESIVRTGCLEGVAALEASLTETENLQFFVMEITVKLVSGSCITAHVKITPYGTYCMSELHILKIVVDDQFEVLVYRKHRNGIEIGQHAVYYLLACL